MLTTSLERLGGLFDRQFLVAYWGPIFIGAVVSAAIVALGAGSPEHTLERMEKWLNLSGAEQILIGIISVITITVVAYIVSVFTMPLVRIYEGNWPAWAAPLARRMRQNWLNKQRQLLKDVIKGERLYFTFYLTFPRDPSRVKPTRLGNVLAAAEEYPRLRYNMDAVLWWPRLFPVMGEALRTQVEASLTPMIALLNLATIAVVVGIGGGIWLWFGSSMRLLVWGIVCTVVLLFVAFGCYRAAAVQAVPYTQAVRTAFDLYRFDLLAHLHIPLPTPEDERALWENTSQWIYFNDLRFRAKNYVHDPTPSGS